MILAFFIFLLANMTPTILGCGILETRKTCECRAVYSLGQPSSENARTLFTLPNYEDCGINLGCDKQSDCQVSCQNRVRQTLGGQSGSLTLTGKNKICSLVHLPISGQIIANSSIRVWASWQYGSCRAGIESIVEDLCCGRRCSCQINAQKASADPTDVQISLVGDLTSQISIPDVSYECSSLNTMAKCRDECLNQVGIYFGNNEAIRNPDPQKYNLNIFLGDDENSPVKLTNFL